MLSLNRRHISWILTLVLFPLVALQAQSAEELAAKAANPLANMISFPVQNNTNFGLGPFDRTNNVLNIQPVVPFANGSLITRTIFPIIWIPDVTSETEMVSTGLSDILFSAWYAKTSGSATYGIGPVVSFPSGGDVRGSEKFSVGPTAVVLAAVAPWTIGALVNNIWSVAGDSAATDVNQGFAQYFVTRTFAGGWYINTAPIITWNWEAADGQQWVVPFGGGGGKIFRVGKVPINGQLGFYYNVVKPDVGPDWQLRVQLQALFPL